MVTAATCLPVCKRAKLLLSSILEVLYEYLTAVQHFPRLWPGTRGIKKPAPKAQGAQKKGKRREKRDYFNYIPIYLYLKVYQTVDKNEAVQFISFSLIREK